MKKLFINCLILFILPFATMAQSVGNGNGEYALTKYHIDVIVNENNSFFITEHITAYYHVPKRGIERMLPLRNKIDRLDGTTSRNYAKIRDIDVKGDVFKVYNESGYRVVSLGTEERMMGSKEYVISYLYDIGKDRCKGFDEFYFNLIGDNWDTTIDQVAFTITMPKPFDASKVGFTSGVAGSTYSGHVTFEVNGHVISGTYNRTLKAEEALTIRLELPDGYFVVEEEPVDILTNTPIVLSCFFVLVAFGLWFKYGRGQRPVVTTEFYPPKDLNSAEVGFMYHGAADSNGVVSLLIYLANKGYIHIEETEEKELSAKSSGFKIKKLKEYDGDNTNERLFLAGLFKSNDEVRSADLQNSFYTTLNTIVGRLNANKHQIFEKSSINKNFYFVLMAIAIIVLITFRPVFEYGGLGELLSSLPFTGIGFIIFILFTIVRLPISMTINGRPTTSRVASMLLGLLFGATFGIPIFLLMVLPALLTDKTHVVVYIVGIICITLIFICMKHTKKRTPYGNDLLGRIMGFKDFLKIAEKPRLEQLVTKDPEYFYNILPFTYVLGISDKWIKKFETIALQAPNWYRGNKGFDSVSFSRFMSKTMTNASKAMTQSPSGGSSRSGGGGRSGGGSGGGGGRSR